MDMLSPANKSQNSEQGFAGCYMPTATAARERVSPFVFSRFHHSANDMQTLSNCEGFQIEGVEGET